MSQSVHQVVMEILARQAERPVSALSAQTTLDQLGIDSLGKAEIIFAIEEAFDIEVPFNANDPEASALDLSSVGAVVAAVERMLADAGKAP